MKRFVLFIAILGLAFSQLVFGQSESIKPTKIITPAHFDISKPLRDVKIIKPDERRRSWKDNTIKNKFGFLEEFKKPSEFQGPDPVLQDQDGKIVSTKGVLQNFDGVDNVNGVHPPDTDGDVGPNHYVQMVNLSFEIFDKAGNSLYGPADNQTIWEGFDDGQPYDNANDGDPIVIYDEYADRWLTSQFVLNSTNSKYYELVAISVTPDPTGSWYRYAFEFDNFPDYPKIGVWRDGYYMAINQFANASSWAGGGAVVMDRNAMLAGNATASMVFFDLGTSYGSLLPADADGPTLPPSGAPGYFVSLETNALRVWQLSVNWTTPSSSTITASNISTSAFTYSGISVTQPGTTQTLDDLSDRLMYRLQYRNFGTHQTMVTNHTVNAGSSRAGVRWYELRNTGSSWSMFQQGTYAPNDGLHRWMGSVAMNASGDIALGYSVSGSSVYPSIRYTGRQSSDPLGTMSFSETSIIVGTGNQTSPYARWGDYSSMTVDPSDDFTFWYTQEYIQTSGYANWRTRIASFQLYTPSSPPVADFSASNLYPIWSTNVLFTDQSTGGTPTSWSWSFSPSTVTYVSGSSTSQNPIVRFNNNGAYTVALSVTNAFGNDTETKTDYIHVGQPGVWTGAISTNWNTTTNWDNHEVSNSSTGVSITPAAIRWPTKTGNLIVGTDCQSLNMSSGYTELTVTGNLTISAGRTFYVDPTGNATIRVGGNWTNNGTFTPGQSTVEFDGVNNSVINSPAGGPAYLINDDFSIWPGNWSGDIGTGDGQFNQNASSFAGGSSPEARFFYLTGTNTRRMIHNPINTSGLTNATLDFKYSINDYSGATSYTINAQYSTDGSTWINLWSSTPGTNVSATSISLPLTTAGGLGAANYYIAFMITGNTWDINYWYIDDVQLYYNTSGLEIFNNVAVSKINALVSTNGDVDVQQDFTIKPGAYFTNSTGDNFNVFGNATFEADASGMASFIDNGISNFVNFPPDIQVYLVDGRWHFIGMPVNSAMAGVFHLPAGHSDIYLRTHNEATNTWGNYIVPVGTPLALGQGYEVWVGSPPSIGGFTQPETVTFSGIPNTGGYTTGSGGFYGLQYTPTHGLNLIANPYPSALQGNINSWSKSNLANSIWTWSKTSGNYVYWGSGSDYGFGLFGTMTGGVIPAMQGFFVEATGSSPVVTLPQTDRIHNNQAFYKESEIPSNTLRLEVDANDYKDIIFVTFNEQATEEFDNNYDVRKLYGLEEAPQLYSIIANGQLSINALPELTGYRTVQLGFECGLPGAYSFIASDIESFNGSVSVYLEDTKEGTLEDLVNNPDYSFNYDLSDEPTRFVLHFGNPNGIGDDETLSTLSIYSYGDMVYIQKPIGFEGQIRIYDMLGQELVSQKATGEGLISIPVNSGTGYYFVKVQSGGQLVTEKVFIK